MAQSKIVDSHVHLINHDSLSYPWIDTASGLDKNFLVEDFREATQGIAITDIVFVEVGGTMEQCVDEVDWVRSLIAAEPRIKAITARAPLTEPSQAEGVLEALKERPEVKSIREVTQGQPAGTTCSESFTRGVKLAAEAGFAVELCIYHPELGDVLSLLEACPDVRFVIDHCAKPAIKEGLLDPWRDQIKAVAAHENVVCKISALLTEADLENWRPDDFVPYADHVVESFGSERVLYGGDWPVVTRAGSYRDWYDVTLRFSLGWTPVDRERYYYENAKRVYGL